MLDLTGSSCATPVVSLQSFLSNLRPRMLCELHHCVSEENNDYFIRKTEMSHHEDMAEMSYHTHRVFALPAFGFVDKGDILAPMDL